MESNEKPLPIISRADARAAGLVRFFDGRVCREGHKTERYVRNGLCCECNRERSRRSVKEHYSRHKQRILDAKRDYYAKNAEAIKARVRARRNRLKQEKQQAAQAAV
ncbi:hypothetical protein [Burkholderia ubonensis]|uniref:hypothetical protein n=1 Tax=Burkholderia ubonensis TaxID=101571 RepID=UPI0009B4088E|nr:hypothetical protein [Burkholderia ubonensis]